MREIKFRAWDKKFKKMIIPDAVWKSGDISYDTRFYSKDDIILIQCTGLKDKNGEEIYEGDIVERYGVLYQVKFGQFVDVKGYCQCGFYLYDFEEDIILGNLGYSFIEDNPLKVIGNIFENPELLKGEER